MMAYGLPPFPDKQTPLYEKTVSTPTMLKRSTITEEARSLRRRSRSVNTLDWLHKTIETSRVLYKSFLNETKHHGLWGACPCD